MARISSAAYVTAVLQFLQAYNRGDLEALERSLDPQVEWHSAVSHAGRAEVRAMLESFRGRFSQPQVRPEDFREAGGHVLIVVSFYEDDPDAPRVNQRQSWVASLGDDGLIRRVVTYPTPGDAARALEGLADGVHKVHA